MESLQVTLPDLAYWKSQIRCQAACPVHTDARGYIRAIAEGDFERAYLIARGPNPLASICGRVCGAPCETDCRRGDFDRPIAIRALKRFVCERYGSESPRGGGRELLDFLMASVGTDRECQDLEEFPALVRGLLGGDVAPIQSKSVGIIGSGPAGLAAAHDLALLGADVTIYEMEPVLAGMLALGIPEYRLPRELIRQEVDVIRALGVEAVTNCRVGQDVSFEELRDRHDAVVVAVGAKRSRKIGIPGEDAIGVSGGVELLRDVALGKSVELGDRVIVIGGGNVAYDIGRTVVRQTSFDAARAARRQNTDSQVTLCSLESFEEMPADDIEILEGDEEGVVRRNGLGPVAILTDDQGRVRGVRFRRCLRVYDENHRFAPVYDDEDQETIECDTVLMAAGQTFDLSFLDSARDGVETNERGLIVCDPETGVTSADDVFVAGDLAYGPKLLIHAVASGKKVARAIYERLTGQVIDHSAVELHWAQPEYQREEGYERRGRVSMPTRSPEERIASQEVEVEKGYDEEAARAEAGRCLDCGVNTIFDGRLCILCGGCADVCPSLCLKLVSVDKLVPTENGIEVAGRDSLASNLASDDLSVSIDRQLGDHPRSQAAAIIKDETICIRCALCAERCPTGAITMERFLFREVPKCRAA